MSEISERIARTIMDRIESDGGANRRAIAEIIDEMLPLPEPKPRIVRDVFRGTLSPINKKDF